MSAQLPWRADQVIGKGRTALRHMASEKLRITSAARRAGVWPSQHQWILSGFRQVRVCLYQASGRVLGGRILGALPNNWVTSVADIYPNPILAERIEVVQPGSRECAIVFPPQPRGFEFFTQSVRLRATFDFIVRDALVAPRSGLVWLEEGPILGESCGSMFEFLSWAYAAHDLLQSGIPPRLNTSSPVLCVPSSGYFHLLLETLPGLLRVLERPEPTGLLVWSSAPRYVREISALLQEQGAVELFDAPGPVRVQRASISGRRMLSGQFDADDLHRLRALARKNTILDACSLGTCRIFVTRARAARSLLNESEVADFLVRRGYLIVDPGGLSVREQMTLFQRATYVVGAHGAGLTNLAWCAPATRVVEILRPDRNLDCYARLSHLAGLRYRPLLASSNGQVDLRDLAIALEAVSSAGV